MENNNSKGLNKNVVFMVSFVLIVGVALFGFSYLKKQLTTVELSISSPENSTVYVAESKFDDFVEAGEGNISVRVKKNSLACAKAELNQQVTQQCVHIVEEPTSLVLEDFVDGVVPEVVTTASLRDIYSTSNQLLGVENSSNTIMNVGIDDFVPPRLDFVSLPYAKNVSWFSSNSFVYKSFADAFSFNNRSTFIPSGLNGVELEMSDPLSKSILVSTDQGVYLSTDAAASFDKIMSLKPSERHVLGLSGGHAVYADFEPAANYASETEEFVDNSNFLYEGGRSKVALKPIEGGSLLTYELENVADVSGVIYSDSDSAVVLVDDSTVRVINAQGGNETVVYYKQVNIDDVVYINDKVILGGTDGIWRFFPSTGNMSQLVSFEEGRLVNDSFSINNGLLYYSTVSDDFGASGQVYRITP